MQSIEVVIFGRKFRLRSEDHAQTLAIAEDLSARLKDLHEKYETLDFSRLLLLSAFQRELEIDKLIKENESLKNELNRMNQMIEKFMNI